MKQWLTGTLFSVLPACAFGGIVEGMVIPGDPLDHPPTAQVSAVILPPSGATVITFDDAPAPCLFAQSPGPVTTNYASMGVIFSGPAPNSGGAILNQCGAFGVTGYSKPNFLAFNIGAGFAVGPETITFVRPVESVQLNVGSISGGTVTLACFVGDISASTSSVVATSLLATISVQRIGITRCELSFTGSALVADDLAFVVAPAFIPAADVPAINQFGLIALGAILVAVGALRFLH